MASFGNQVRAGGAYIELTLDKAAALQGLRQFEQRFAAFSRAVSKFKFGTNLGGNIQATFLRDANNSIKVFSSLSEQFRRTGRALVYGGLAATIVFSKLAGLITKSLKAFSQEEQLAGRFASVFRDLADDAQSFSEVLAKDVKQSVSEIKDEMATFQGVLLGAGFDPGQALELSTLLTEATQDLLAFDDSLQSPTEAMERMLGGLAGMVIPVQRFGADIRKANIDKELEKLQGAMEATSAHATQQERILARLNIMFEALGRAGAIGQARREAETLAASFRGLQGATRMMFVSLGRAISGYGQRAIQFFTLLAGAIQDLATETPGVVQAVAALAIALTAATGAMVAGGIVLLLISGNLKLLGMAATAVSMPFRALSLGVTIFAKALYGMSAVVATSISGVLSLARAFAGMASVGVQILQTSIALNTFIMSLGKLAASSISAGVLALTKSIQYFAMVAVTAFKGILVPMLQIGRSLVTFGSIAVQAIWGVLVPAFQAFGMAILAVSVHVLTFGLSFARGMAAIFVVQGQLVSALGVLRAAFWQFAFAAQAALTAAVNSVAQATGTLLQSLLALGKGVASTLVALGPLLKRVAMAGVYSFTSLLSLSVTTAATIASSFFSVLVPIGAVVAAVLGLAAAFVIFKPQIDAAFASIFGAGGAVSKLFGSMKSMGSSAFAILSEGFATLVSDGKVAFEGISNAIKGGDLALAFQIAWDFVLLEFYKAYAAIAESWDAWRTYLYTAVNEMWADLSVLFSNGFIEIQAMVDVFRPIFVSAWTSMAAIIGPVWETLMGWINGGVESTTSNFNALWDSSQSTVLQVVDLIKDGFSVTVNFLIGVWQTFTGILQKAWAYARSIVDTTVDYEAEAKRIDEENAKASEKRDAQMGEAILAREKERKRKSEDMNRAKAAAEERIRAEQEERQRKINDDANAAQLDADNKLANTRRDFKNDLKKAKDAADKAANAPRGKGILPEWQQRLADIGKSLTGGEVAKAVVRANSAVFAGDAAMGLAAPSVEMDQLKELRLIRRLTERGNKKKPDFVYQGVSP